MRNALYNPALNQVKFLDSMNLPFLLLKDFFVATFALLDRLLNYPYLLSKMSNGFVIDQQGFIKITKRLLVTYLIGFIVFSGTGLLFLFNPFGTKSADAAWFNDNWAYRKAVTVTVATNTSDRTNADLYLTIDTTGITTKLQSACQDLRFTDTNGNIFPYYIQSCNNNSATNKIWVRTNLIPKDSTTYTMYMYYGNPSASAGSNAQVFNLYSDVTAYWSYEESSAWNTNCNNGTKSILDSSGNASNMQPCPAGAGAATQTTSGKFGSALALNGTTQYADTGADIDQLDLGATDDITISAWVYFNSTASDDGIINKKGGSNSAVNQGWTLYHFSTGNGGDFCLYVSDGTTQEEACSGSYTTLSTWVHVVAVFNRNSGTGSGIWLNGVRDISGSFTITTPSVVGSGANTHFTNTGSSSSSFLDGRLDDVRIYKRALSIPEITQLYNTTGNIAVTNSFASEEKGPSPTLYWEFDQGQGTTAEDTTSNGLDGTLNNTPTWQTENFCISSKCLYFGATNQNVSIADNDKLDFAAADNFTVGAWVKRNGAASANTVIMQKTGANIGSTYTGYKLYMDASGDFCFDTQDGTNAVDSACTSAVDFDDDSWHFVEGVKAATTSITLYVDGKQRAQDASIASTGSLANASTFRVGIDSDGTSNDWLGFIDEVKITRDQTSRTLAQVQADYNARSNPEGVSQQQGNNTQNMPPVLSNGLVAYWKMDENTGTTISDSSGNANTSSAFTGNTAFTTGKYASGLTFDGTNDVVRIPETTSTDLGTATDSFTISSWFKTTATQASGGGYVVAKFSAASNLAFVLNVISTNQLQFEVNGGTDYIAATTITVNDGVWHHFVGVRDVKNLKMYLYLDGVLKDSLAITAQNASNNDDISIGNGSSSYLAQDFNGQVDETRIYNRALSNAEVSGLYNWAPGPSAYWKMDEGVWTNDCSTSTVFDNSGNANSGISCPNGTGSVGGTPGKYGKAGLFDGSNDYVSVADSTSIDPTGSWSISSWIYNSDSTLGASEKYIMSKGNWNTDADSPYRLSSNFGTLILEYRRSFTAYQVTYDYNGAGTFTTNQWIHVEGTFDAATNSLAMYVNGRLVAGPTVMGAAPANNTSVLYLGAHSSGQNFWTGRLDDVRIYNYTRTAAQVVQDMNADHPAPGSPVSTPIGFWKFNEGADNMCSGGTNDACNSGSGSTTYDGTSTATRTNSGKLSRALDFDGVDDVVTITNGSAIDLNENLANFTFSSWIYADSDGEADTGQIFNKGANTYFRVDSQGTTDLDLECNLDLATTDANVNVTDALTTASWNHVACSWNGTTLSVFINGRLSGSSSSGSGAISADANNLLIGGGTSNNFDGKIDEFKVYNSALTVSQIALDANSASAQVLGATGNNSTAGALNAESQEYCIPGDSTTCTSPIGRWDFEEGTGTTAYDTSGTANTGTLSDVPIQTLGKVGKALQFGAYSGNNPRVSVTGSSATLSALNTNFTVEAWFKPRSAGISGHIITKRGTGNVIWDIDESSGTTRFFLRDASSNSITVNFSGIVVNSWNHIVAVKEGTSARVYLNGVLNNTGSNGSLGSVAGTGNLGIGAETAGSNPIDANIDQVRIFDYVRTPAQIAYDYNRGAPVGWWKMDECQGTTINDSSGNNISGTLVLGAGGVTAPGTCSTSSTAWGDGATGKRNSSISLGAVGADQRDDYIDLGSPTALQLQNFTYATWIKRNALGSGQGIIGYSSGGNTGGPFLYFNGSNQLELAKTGTAVCTSSRALTDTTNWHHVVVTYDGANCKFYFDGILDNSPAFVQTFTYSNNALIGANTSTVSIINALIDDMRVYSYPLTATQVKTVVNEGAARYGPVTGAP